MHSIRQSCHSALWGSSGSVYAYATIPIRAFSRSSARSRGALPVFLEPSTPELSTLLSTFNSKVLLPAHLTKEQEKLVYTRINRAKLEAEPVEITLGDVTLPLEHIDRNQLPKRWPQVQGIVRRSQTSADWENVTRILEGFENAGIHVKSEWREYVVRHLGLAGQQNLILKALQRAKATGLRMSEYRVLAQVLRAVHDKAARADWEQEETAKALRMAKQLVELMEDEEHCGGQSRGEMVSENDWRTRPDVIALPTEMAARLAEKDGGDVQEVSKFANRLVNALKQTQFMDEINAIAQRSLTTHEAFSNGARQMTFIRHHCQDLLQLVIVWNALKTSRKVLANDMPMAEEAQEFESRLEQVLTEGLDAAERLLSRGERELSSEFVGYIKDAVDRCR